MRCNICDKTLSETEVLFNKEIDAFEPCSTCLDIAMETAFSQGFHKPDDEIPVEVGDIYGDGIIETLDSDVFSSSYGDAGDIVASYDDYD